ncbi:sigma 54-interacting transcriptional regulator [Priestia taiwanensis]|uniref:Transcriptional antiterminator n=1 Tax=Priestia taiwanensis TaxID=1347902 RepID=A0A917AXP3_9BACI|nr:sigma-54-dependent transcriptional regulator [Priestia taiwanensis]MBM7364432.1 transcriptional regulatory protein LevR/transcriptional regulator with AAA-type ATPase domain [Priestia taiwanensis]GGE81509.1 transcriptional antiterminator [Priestia taiwanensis]
MTRKELIYEAVKQHQTTGGISAAEIANILNLDRANVSSDLNKLTKEGLLLKTNTRPVRFSTSTLIEEQDAPTLPASDQPNPTIPAFDVFANNNKSLQTAIEIAKSAILYPPHGMHSLILGETGVGKSMFASLMYQYALEVEKLKEQAPFITFNCADYANNPQLLLGQLFGVKKGAYTGAIDQKGLIEKADNGILFLDEIHRLPPEGQEMLFTFIDRGIYRRLGETESERQAKVLIISATTEDPESFLLKTFTRRIPMVITLPSLKDRTYEERFTLLKSFFSEESVRLGKELYVTANSMRAFLFYHCPNNIGQLKADVQIACAKAYADFVTKRKPDVTISSSDLPWYVKEGLFIEKKLGSIFPIPNQAFLFSPTEGLQQHDIDIYQESVYDRIDHKYEELKVRGIDNKELGVLMENDLQSYFVHYIKEMNKKMSKENMLKVIEQHIVELTEKIIHLAETNLGKTFDEKLFLGLGLHIQTTLQRIQSEKQIYHPNLNNIRSLHKKEFNVALECIHIMEETLGVTFPIDEAAFLTMFFVLEQPKTQHSTIKVLVLAHGNGIASEMANVANQLLGTEDVVGIDMPLHESPKEFLERVKNYVKSLGVIDGLFILVDMGSLTYIGEILSTEFNIPVRVLSMVSTPHVLEASRKAKIGYNLDSLYEDVKNLTSFYLHNQSKKKENDDPLTSVIITACLTGEGSAIAIKNMLQNYLHYNEDLIEIIPLSIVDEKDLVQVVHTIDKERNVLCVVSNFNIELPYLTFHFQDILNMKGTKQIQELITHEEAYIKMGEALQAQMNMTDSNRMIKKVRQCLKDIQQQANIYLNQENLMGIVLHLCSMIDRLQKQQESITYKNKEAKINDHYLLYMRAKKALANIEEQFHITIPNDEICYIMDFFLRIEKREVTTPE